MVVVQRPTDTALACVLLWGAPPGPTSELEGQKRAAARVVWVVRGVWTAGARPASNAWRPSGPEQIRMSEKRIPGRKGSSRLSGWMGGGKTCDIGTECGHARGRPAPNARHRAQSRDMRHVTIRIDARGLWQHPIT